MNRICLLFAWAYLCIPADSQEFAYPLTARLQSRIPTSGMPAEAYYLPGSGDVSCFEATPSGGRFLCLSETGSIVEWTADNRIRQVADGFLGPMQAKAAPDGTLYVLDLGRGTLSQVATDGTVTRLMGSGSDRVIRERMDPRTFDLPLFTLSRDTYSNSVQLAIDPVGNPYLGILREENTKEGGQDVVSRFFYIFRLENRVTSMVLHWNGTSTLAGKTSLPQFDALSVDKDRNIFMSTDGEVSRLTPSLQYTALVGGRYTVLATNPIKSIVQTDDGNIFLYSPSSTNLFRLFFAELRVDLDAFAKLKGRIARQGNQLIGLDLNEKRLLGYAADPAGVFVPGETARLLRYIPITGNIAFRPAFDNPVSVSTDNQGQIYVVEGADGSVYRIAANGAVQRTARSSFNPDSPPPPRLTSENVPIDALPYPIVAVANDSDNRLYMLDRNCNFFIQTSVTIARRAKEFQIDGGCAEAAIVADQIKRVHVVFMAKGDVQTGTGDPLSGEWNFTPTYSAGRLQSVALLPTGDLLLLGGRNANFWTMTRINPTTKVAVPIQVDASLTANVNLRISSIAADFGGRILAVSCCSTGSSNESGRRYLFSFQLSGTNVLTGQPRPVAFFDGAQQAPESLFSHPRGVLIRTNLSRLYYFEDAQFRAQSAVSLPNRQTWTYTPDAGVQELAVPVSPGFGPTAFRTRIACDRNFEKFVRLGPSAAVAPTQLRLALDTLAAPSRAAACRIELLSVDNNRVMANTTIDMVPDAAKLALIPAISVLEQLTPFKVDPAQTSVTKPVRLFNNAPESVVIRLEGAFPDGISVSPATLTLEPKQSGDFVFTITPKQLFRQHYTLPFRAACTACAQPVNMELSFQIGGRTTSIDITAEAALIEIGALNARNVSRLSATSIVLSGLDETDVVVKTDLGAAPAWFSVQKSSSTRTDDGKLVLGYDVVLNRAALPTRQTSNIVIFETQTQQGVARRFLTVFYFPEGSTVQRLFESGSAGSTINLGTTRAATVTIPVFSRSADPSVYSTYTLGGDSGTVSVPSAQGVVARGTNEIQLDVTRTGTTAEASEIKDIVVVFANGERLIYNLNVITSPLQATTQSKGGERSIGACASSRLLVTPREPGSPYTVVKNVGLRFVIELKDECNQAVNAADKAQVRFTTEPPNGTVTVTSVGGGLWEVFWKPERSGENVPVKIVAVRGVSEREIYAGTLTLSGRVADSVVPSLRSFSIVDAISFQAKTITAPGAFITIYGENLGLEPRLGFDKPGEFPLELGGVQVHFNGKAAPLLYTSPGQVNLQVPYDLDNSEYRMTIRRGDLVSAPASLGVGSASPAVATVSGTGVGPGQVYRVVPDAAPAFATPANPARAGETILIVTTGLGATNPFFEEGKAVPAENQLAVTGMVQVLIGTQLATDVKAYLAPGQIGIYFVSAVVPAGTPTGDAVPLVVRTNGVDSQTVTLAIQ
ncbi:MAG: hypothetical protein ACKV2U_12160 [Bryobacteraceae bacterium]